MNRRRDVTHGLIHINPVFGIAKAQVDLPLAKCRLFLDHQRQPGRL